ncbi:hypothetical protein [Azotobacter chroococcum]|uniref:hypothetical protein n=1 Tax=Azotobacter chroococcum TaxID=353 RepID=UPI0010AE2E90|nr:hypothetical protein [Azotobacter chroococcum]TKD39932.1 hypothetical protein FCG41_11910 [Azotobacter chroococcum]
MTEIVDARAQARAAHQAWMDAEQALEAAKRAVGEAQQRYYALADQAVRLEGPTVRRRARAAEIARLEAALKEFADE